MRALKKLFHKLKFFVELLHGGVCGAVSNTLLGLGVWLELLKFNRYYNIFVLFGN